MKWTILCVILSFLAVNAISENESWIEFKKQHGKIYETKEDLLRFNIFRSNVQKIEEHNAKYEKGEETYFQRINHFSDWTEGELNRMFATKLPKRPAKPEGRLYKMLNVSIPESYDWRTRGVVTSIKNQGCGDCWAHAVAGVLEGQYALKYGTLFNLSRQNLVDCTLTYGNFGCRGGYFNTTYKYLQENGIEAETDYPYIGEDRACRFDKSKVATKVKEPVYFPPNDENALKEGAATVGPIGVSIDASFFVSYGGGVYKDKRCSNDPDQLNHAVLVVGYGNENGRDYWLIKNSWGRDWGEAGYMKLARNAGNLCGVAVEPNYVILT